jgi:deoxyadenosine/deoxycytidine kinase
MGKIIAVVGTTGVGKTSLVRALCKKATFEVGLEQHKERPFQEVFKTNPNYALPNQIDYMLFRAEQEQYMRKSAHSGLVDGGLDLDYHGFTRLFYFRGWLSKEEYYLCERLYAIIRANLPPPELVIHLTAKPEVIYQRLQDRKRINIADPKDVAKLAAYLNSWLSTISTSRFIQLDVSENDPGYRHLLQTLLPRLQPFLK